MKAITTIVVAGATLILLTIAALAYPPAVGILGKSTNCLNCHVNNGKWVDGPDLIIDIVDKQTNQSLKLPDGSFVLEAVSGKPVTLITIIGYRKKDSQQPPHRNAWLYIDSSRIGTQSLSTFPSGWDVNLPMSCRLVGDKSELYPDADVTVLPMTILPGPTAADGSVTLHVMLTSGDAIKGNAKEGMIGSYFQRTMILKVKS